MLTVKYMIQSGNPAHDGEELSFEAADQTGVESWLASAPFKAFIVTAYVHDDGGDTVALWSVDKPYFRAHGASGVWVDRADGGT